MAPPERDSAEAGSAAEPPSAEATRLLRRSTGGDVVCQERLLELVFADLRARAAQYLRTERNDHTLQPTALVHEAWIRLIDQRDVEWQNEAHFLGVAAQAMRRVLVDHARAKKRVKRGGAWGRIELPIEVLQPDGVPEDKLDLVAVDRALEELRTHSDRMARIVELRFFAGMSKERIAKVLQISRSTVGREWRLARAWLGNFLSAEGDG